MAHWFKLTICREGGLRVDPDRHYAHWHPGDNAYCIHCGQRTPVLYALPLPGPMPADAVCRACAVRTMREERQQH